MSKEKSNMTTCKACGAEIAKSAKICPNCGAKNKKPIYKRVWFIILAIIVVLGVLGAALGGGEDTPSGSSSSDSASKEEQQKIEYTKVTADDMVKDLEDNAANASDKYKDQYFKITGNLSNIDSDGSYISIEPVNEEFSMYSVQCYIKDDSQLKTVKSLKSGDKVVVKGKVTDVGEVLGYSVDMDSIKAAD